jgi:uncharacterized membrane protein
MDKFDSIAWAALASMFIIGIMLYPQVQDPLITHWNAQGEPDDYMDKDLGLWLIPGMSLIVLYFLQIIPKIAVYKANIKKFYKYYGGFKVLFVLFMLGLYTATLLPNIGYNFPINYAVVPLISLLFFYLGYILPHTRRNFFIGIRTPWTLSDDKVWEKTHKVGGKTFQVLALFLLISLALPKTLLLFIAAILIAVAYLFVYSYLEFKKVKR